MSIELAKNLCEEKGHELLYLTKFGSHLYGTNTPESDIDYKGLFLPSKQSLLLGEKCRSLRYSSGNDSDRNTKDDVDIDLYSIHYFLELVKKGETNSLDILFSPSHKECIEYYDTRMDEIFNNPLKLFNPRDANAYTGYAIGQAKKYGQKGSRLGVLKRIYYFLNYNIDNFYDKKLKDVSTSLLNNFFDKSYCFQKEVNEETALVICGKVHLFNITLQEFYNRISREYKKYGYRSEQAEKGEGIDWKAISHAIRAIEQMEQLLREGKITFPIKNVNYIKDIKQGILTWKEAEKSITKGLNKVDQLKESNNVVEGKIDKEFINQQILKFYE